MKTNVVVNKYMAERILISKGGIHLIPYSEITESGIIAFDENKNEIGFILISEESGSDWMGDVEPEKSGLSYDECMNLAEIEPRMIHLF